LVISVYMRIDQVMIKEMLNDAAVGQYAAAVKISEAWYFIPIAITSSLFPAIVEVRARSRELYMLKLQQLYRLMIWLSIIVASAVAFLSDVIVFYLFGGAYSLASNVLVVHIWTGIFVFLGVAFSKFLIAENLGKKALYRTVFGAASNVLLNYLLIPAYGIMGAACATLIAQAMANLGYDFFDKDLRGHIRIKLLAFSPFFLVKKRS